MRTTIEQDGDDLIVVIPQEILDELQLKTGDKLVVSHDPETSIITLKQPEK